jgi:hypothetical protein
VVGSIAARQGLEERNPRTGLEFAVSRQDFGCQSDPGGFSAPGEQFVAKLDQGRGALLGGLASIAGPINQRTTALRDRL